MLIASSLAAVATVNRSFDKKQSTEATSTRKRKPKLMTIYYSNSEFLAHNHPEIPIIYAIYIYWIKEASSQVNTKYN